jgi:cystathionine beta-synthase
VLKAEPPVTSGEVAGAVAERELMDALFSGRATLHDPLERHIGAPLPTIGSGEQVERAVAALQDRDALMVFAEGKPVGVLTRQDLLSYVEH